MVLVSSGFLKDFYERHAGRLLLGWGGVINGTLNEGEGTHFGCTA